MQTYLFYLLKQHPGYTLTRFNFNSFRETANLMFSSSISAAADAGWRARGNESLLGQQSAPAAQRPSHAHHPTFGHRISLMINYDGEELINISRLFKLQMNENLYFHVLLSICIKQQKPYFYFIPPFYILFFCLLYSESFCSSADIFLLSIQPKLFYLHVELRLGFEWFDVSEMLCGWGMDTAFRPSAFNSHRSSSSRSRMRRWWGREWVELSKCWAKCESPNESGKKSYN